MFSSDMGSQHRSNTPVQYMWGIQNFRLATLDLAQPRVILQYGYEQPMADDRACPDADAETSALSDRPNGRLQLSQGCLRVWACLLQRHVCDVCACRRRSGDWDNHWQFLCFGSLRVGAITRRFLHYTLSHVAFWIHAGVLLAESTTLLIPRSNRPDLLVN